MFWEDVDKLNDANFQRSTGVKRKTFNVMVMVVSEYFANHFGRPFKLSVENSILLCLMYWREYRTQYHIGLTYKVHESTVCRIIKMIEDILIKSGSFSIDGRKRLNINHNPLTAVIIDATETPIERPKKGQKGYYSGKKKGHTYKTQIIMCRQTLRIISIHVCKGKTHDFQLFKDTKIIINPLTVVFADSGYQGIQNIVTQAKNPQKKPKGGKLTKQEKKKNRELSSLRVKIEHVNREIKVFRILKGTYRNKRKRFGLRMNLIAAIYNYDLAA